MEENNQRIPAIVIDTGSGFTKAGIAGEDVEGTCKRLHCPRDAGVALGIYQRDYYVGREALDRHAVLRLAQPIYRGGVISWPDLEDLWAHVFTNELRVNSELQPCLVSEPPLNPKAERERTTQVFFEKFGVPAFFLGNQAAMSIYASARISGVVLEAGDAVTFAVPIFQGYALPQAIQKLNMGGMDLTDFLGELMNQRYHGQLTALRDPAVLTDIKETLAYVALDYPREVQLSQTESTLETNYTLPDGKVVTIGSERFRVPEAMFQPALVGRRLDGVPDLIATAVRKCAANLHSILLSNVMLGGGNSVFRNFEDRLERELRQRTAGSVSITAKAERRFSAWVGGSILSSLASFQQLWVQRSEYDEYGATVIHRKCF